MVFKRRQKATARTEREEEEERAALLRTVGPHAPLITEDKTTSTKNTTLFTDGGKKASNKPC